MIDFSKNLAWQMSHPDIEIDYNLDYTSDSIWLIPTLSEEARSLPFYVQEVGRTIAGKNYYVSRRNLDSFMIACIIGGQMDVRYNGEHIVSNSDSVVWLDCQLPHTFRIAQDCEQLDCYFVHFSGSGAKTYAAYMRSLDGTWSVSPRNKDAVLMYLKKIIDLYSAPSRTAYSDLAACTYLSSLCMELIKSAKASDATSVPAAYLVNIKSYLESHYSEKVTLEELAQKFFISRAYLQKQFKQYYGCSPTDYLIQLRLRKAKVLLRSTSRSVNDIAYDVGFNNTSYFIRAFNQTEGVTPLKYRKMWASI